MTKQLQSNSLYAQYDVDGDGIVSDEELARSERMIMLENEDKRQDAQRNMAWFALFGMLLYPLCILIASWLSIDHASTVLGSMAPTYFVSVAAIVAAFYGSQAYSTSKAPKQSAIPPAPVKTVTAPAKPAASESADEEIVIRRKPRD